MKYLLLFYFLINIVHSQDVMDQIANNGDESGNSELTTESISRIAPSRKIMLLTNENSSYFLGDFISLINKSQLVVRALVAKVHEKSSGIKIVKIYNEDEWKLLKENQKIQILRGDDSAYKIAGSKAEGDNELGSLIENEDDLFKDTTISESGLELEENTKRIIKPDYLISANMGGLPVANDTGGITFHMMASIGRQFSDNIWGEAGIGWSRMSKYPALDLSTDIYSYYGRLKYTIDAPFYTIIQPYIGVQFTAPYSPGAGVNTAGDAKAIELASVDALKQFKPVFGVTLLKRMVPGWFFRADIGLDMLTVGLCLEF